MKLDLYALSFFVMLVPGIFLFNLHPYLIIDEKRSKFLQKIFTIFCFIGIILLVLDIITIGLFLSILSPLYHFFLFRFLYGRFVKKYKRPPKDVFMNYNWDHWEDRGFALLFFFGAIFSSFFFIVIFI